MLLKEMKLSWEDYTIICPLDELQGLKRKARVFHLQGVGIPPTYTPGNNN